ncbi:HYC_CC_PP family protein [Tenacibaculum sp. ZS6-P6]|uniref:HYC_CC_PP family protein n=1 Tax=Tenacibaculum sp. ZS6-P6 TaxID=3447503 RepID=UPI003F9989BD
MNILINKIVSILMALVVVFSTMSFTINSHFCGDTLVNTSYFNKAKTCGMEITQEIDNERCSITKKNCCKDITQLVEGQNNLKKTSLDKVSFNKQLFVLSFYYSYINLFVGLHNKVIPFKDYSPPLVIKDIQVLDEVYLI